MQITYYVNRLVDILPAECPNAAKGCDARRLTRGVLKEHIEKSCGYVEVKCTYVTFRVHPRHTVVARKLL